jgi:hypothetical protein
MVDAPRLPAAGAAVGAAAGAALDVGAAVLAAWFPAPKILAAGGAAVLAGGSVFPRPPKRLEGVVVGAVVAGADAPAEEAPGLPIPANKPGAAAGVAKVDAPFDAPPLDAGGAPPSEPPDGAGLKSDTPGAPDDG